MTPRVHVPAPAATRKIPLPSPIRIQHLVRSPLVLRKCACKGKAVGEACSACSEQDQERRAGRLIQAKPKVGRPGDKYEEEADRVADQVLRRGPSARPAPDVRRREAPGGGGEPLDAETRAFFEPRFGYDFSFVRIHADGEAARSASELGARAYTSQHNIVFGGGQYRPGTGEGNRLLAHELTHVLQQTRWARAGEPPSSGVIRSHAPSGVIQRDPGDPYDGRILSLEEVQQDPERENIRKNTGQTKAKVCRSINETLDDKNCPTSLGAGMQVRVVAEKVAGRWLEIDCSGIVGFGPEETCHVLGVFVEPVKAGGGSDAKEEPDAGQDSEGKDEEGGKNPCACKKVKSVDTKKLVKKPGGKIQFDVGGEGAYAHANNVNVQRCAPPYDGTKLIPNLICASGNSIPLPAGTADELYCENTPIFPSEYARVTADKGFMSLFHPREYAIDAGNHKNAVEATGLTYTPSMSKKHKFRGLEAILTAFNTP